MFLDDNNHALKGMLISCVVVGKYSVCKWLLKHKNHANVISMQIPFPLTKLQKNHIYLYHRSSIFDINITLPPFAFHKACYLYIKFNSSFLVSHCNYLKILKIFNKYTEKISPEISYKSISFNIIFKSALGLLSSFCRSLIDVVHNPFLILVISLF